MQIYIIVFVALGGLLMYLLSSNGKAQEVGRICFFTGLLVLLLQMSKATAGLF